MMDLGKYAAEVISAWGISLASLAGLVWWSVRRDRKVRAELERTERDHG
ncbi:MAG: heme exporter protein CcmD [Limimaricola soesokkakensis]